MSRALSCFLFVAALLGGSGAVRAAETGTVEGEVQLTREGAPVADRSLVVVYLEGAPGKVAPRKAEQKMAQHNLAFDPGLLVVQKGESVEFPNEDKVFHNVFSLSRASRFDLGLYKSGSSKAVTFHQTGVVDVYCNIHPQMIGKIKVIDAPHFEVTGADGRFKLEGVPAGTYPIVAWLRSGDEFKGEVTVKAGATSHVSVALTEHAHAPRHLRKDGTPYGRYK